MSYLFAAYSIIWVLLAVYLFVLGNRQSKLMKEMKFLQEMQKK
jgi:CcmD family protein